MKDRNELKKICMGLVNQLYDLAEVPVDKRQSINDAADDYIFDAILSLLVDSHLSLDEETCNDFMKEPLDASVKMRAMRDNEPPLPRPIPKGRPQPEPITVKALREKLQSMRITEKKLRKMDADAQLKAYGYTDCINDLLQWLYEIECRIIKTGE